MVTTLVLFLIAKSTISASFLIIYPFAGELYPTQLRGLGIGLSAYVGGLGLVIIPFVTYLVSIPLIYFLFLDNNSSGLGKSCIAFNYHGYNIFYWWFIWFTITRNVALPSAADSRRRRGFW